MAVQSWQIYNGVTTMTRPLTSLKFGDVESGLCCGTFAAVMPAAVNSFSPNSAGISRTHCGMLPATTHGGTKDNPTYILCIL